MTTVKHADGAAVDEKAAAKAEKHNNGGKALKHALPHRLKDSNLKITLDKATYKKEYGALAAELGRLQRVALERKIPVLLVFEGWDAAGKGDSINRLVSNWDMRGVRVVPTAKPTDEESMRPFLWRFWRGIPARGQIGVFDRSWYYPMLEARVMDGMEESDWKQRIDTVRRFEQALADDGTVLVKFFVHISRKTQAKRFEAWEGDRAFAWKVTRADWKRHKKFKKFEAAADELLQATHSDAAPWVVVPGTDRRFRRLSVMRVVVDALRGALEPSNGQKAAPVIRLAKGSNPIDKMDLKVTLPEEKYDKQVGPLQDELRRLQHLCYTERLGVVIAFEGSDAAGKGGAIRRLLQPLDPRGYTVVPIAAPQGEEKTHHYLWRFWRQLPKAGHWSIFDRTWYGRVLVERCEGFAKPEEWQRAYQEIRDFEAHLAEERYVLVKFWLQIDKDEQLRRFKARQGDPDKQWKITDEDWRNREKWDAYNQAVGDMVRLTSTPQSPWTLVEADDKLWARVKILKTVSQAVIKGLSQVKD